MPQVRGQAAAKRSSLVNVFKTLIQTAVFWLLFLLIVPAGIDQFERWLGWDQIWNPGWLTFGLGIILFSAAGTLGLLSGMSMAVFGRGTPLPMDCPNQLVVVGPYRYLRNPMVVAGLSQGVAVGLMMGSISVIFYSLLGAPVWNFLVRPWEEADLEQRFGDSYRYYRDNLPCWIPSRTPFQFPSESERDST